MIANEGAHILQIIQKMIHMIKTIQWNRATQGLKKKKRKKKDVCLPFSDRPKIFENKGQLFFLIFFFYYSHFAFLNKNVKIKCHII